LRPFCFERAAWFLCSSAMSLDSLRLITSASNGAYPPACATGLRRPFAGLFLVLLAGAIPGGRAL